MLWDKRWEVDVNMADRVNLKDLQMLSNLAGTEEWEALCRMMEARRRRDANSIITYPEHEPIKLATKKAFYRGRRSAMNLIKKQVEEAPKMLEKRMEK